MEQHPVPQDIKSFQFRLVGDMTIRQFAFLAGGAVIAYFIFVLPLPTYIKYPLVVLFAGGGAATAFVPINERPLDRWLVAFLKAIFGPTRLIWIKTGEPLELFTQSYAVTDTQTTTAAPGDRQQLEEYLASLPSKPEEAVDKNEKERLAKIDFTIGETLKRASPSNLKNANEPRPSLAPQAAPPTKILQVRSLNGEEKLLPQLTGVKIRKLGSAVPRGEIVLPKTQTDAGLPKMVKTPTAQVSSPVPPKPQPPLTRPEPTELFSAEDETIKKAKEVIAQQSELDAYQATVKRLEAEKKILEKKAKEERERAEKLRREFAQRQAAAKSPAPTEPLTPASQAKTQTKTPPIPASPPTRPLKKLVLPTITDTPNVINGVVADWQGNFLENAIVVVKDSENTPVRALKSNTLGQFAISTPLRNGSYTVEVEKEGYSFDPIYQEVTGAILPPLEIRSRK